MAQNSYATFVFISTLLRWLCCAKQQVSLEKNFFARIYFEAASQQRRQTLPMMSELEYTYITSNSKDLNWSYFLHGHRFTQAVFKSSLDALNSLLSFTEEVKICVQEVKSFFAGYLSHQRVSCSLWYLKHRVRTKSTAHKDRQLLKSGVKIKLSHKNDCAPKKVRIAGVHQTIKHTSSVS